MVEQNDEILLTIFLKHDQTKNLGEINAKLDEAGFWKKFPPEGARGGRDGAPHAIWIERNGERIALNGRSNDTPIQPGDLIVHHAAGGGGCGDPRQRDRALVERDVTYGYITAESARKDYGLA